MQKFEALINRARSGGGYCEAVEVEAEGPLEPLVFPTIAGCTTIETSTSFTALIEEWARKNHIDNPQTKQKVEGHFNRLAEFLGQNDGAQGNVAKYRRL